MLGLIKTQCKMEVRILSGGVTKILTLHGMSKIDFQPDFRNALMLSFLMMYNTMGSKVDGLAVREHYLSKNQGCTPRPAPPRPGQKWLPWPAPTPKKFNTAPPRPAPPRKKIVLPRPENIDRMFRGKVRGKCSYITKRFCESKTFEQYFLAPKVLLEDIQIPPIHF